MISRTQLRSVRAFLRKEVEQKKLTVSGDHIIISPEEEEKEFLRKRLFILLQ
jgi:hypothetical protein